MGRQKLESGHLEGNTEGEIEEYNEGRFPIAFCNERQRNTTMTDSRKFSCVCVCVPRQGVSTRTDIFILLEIARCLADRFLMPVGKALADQDILTTDVTTLRLLVVRG
ncbi:hypothetical protein BsWGS_25074 [Bradybaena similaris]